MQNPLITDAAGLAPYLRHVRRLGYHGYDWSADPPCHASSSGMANSFHFGDAEGGGVKVGCWAGCQGPGFVKRIEEALGIRLQVNVDGKLTYQSNRPGIRPSVRQPRPVAPRPPDLQYEVLPATPAEGPITLEDWFADKIWFVGAGNKGSRKHVATWRHNGATWTFRHSKKPEEGGVKLARFGGQLPGGEQVQPWASFEAIEALIAETPELRETERRPCVSFAGDADTHHPKPIGCVDADFKPDKDTDGIGAAFTAHVRQALIDAGCPVYSSTSWNGFHALWRMEPWQDGKLHVPVNDGRRFRAWPSDAKQPFHGARVEVFAPGDKQLVALWRYRPIANCGPGQVIPVLTYRKIEAILQAACEAARGEAPEPPVAEEAPVPEPPVVEEAPVPEPPVAEEALVPEPPVAEEAPVPDPPVAEEALVPEPPVAEEAPVPDPPVVEEAPVPDPPVAEEAPVPEPPVAEEAPVPEPASHGKVICENEGCRRQFRIGPISLARKEAGQLVVCRRCDAAAQMTQADLSEAAAAEPVPEPEPGSPPEDAPQTDGNTTWCRRHSLVSIGPECTGCRNDKPKLEIRGGGI